MAMAQPLCTTGRLHCKMLLPFLFQRHADKRSCDEANGPEDVTAQHSKEHSRGILGRDGENHFVVKRHKRRQSEQRDDAADSELNQGVFVFA